MTRQLLAALALLVPVGLIDYTWAAAANGTTSGADHPWVSFPVSSSGPENYITNLRDGESIETPFVLKFGLSRYGLAGISLPVAGAGHHHLLINRDLPLDFSKPLPFDEHYLHFGKGQMETVLALKPGNYTLRMLLADHRHIPYFVYGKPVHITVTRLRTDIDPQSLLHKEVSMLAPRDGEKFKSAFRVQFHASGLNVGHMNIKGDSTGHFVLMIDGHGTPQRLAFANGWTETWLKPPPGRYTLKLALVSNDDPNIELAVSKPVSVTVEK